MKILKITSGVIAFLFAITVLPAGADTITFDLGLGNSAISGFTGPYANVLVNLTDSTHATITFTSLTSGGNTFLFGGAGTVGVNVNAASWTLGTITGSNGGTGFTLGGPFSNGGAGNEGGFGPFNQTINTFDGYTHSSDNVSFTLTDTSGTWASAGSVLTRNALGQFMAAAHIFVTSSPANAANGALATGYATVPDGGSTVALLGLAMLGICAVRVKLRRS